MFIRINPQVILTLIVISLMVNCSGERAPETLDPGKSQSQVFVDMLTATDTTDVCVSRTMPHVVKTYGADFVSEDYVRLGCMCITDNAKHVAQSLAPDQPRLQNAFVQMAVNLDVQNTLFLGENASTNLSYFVSFMETQGPELLGFSSSDLMSSVRLWAEKKEHLDFRSLDSLSHIPSCVASIEAAKSTFPNWDPNSGSVGLDAHMALHKIDEHRN